MKKSESPAGCDPVSGCCDPVPAGMDRREFLKSTAIGASMMMVPGMPLFAGPFDENDYLKYIPADKKLDPAWIRSLFERGQKDKYSDREALEHIGMPVGGLFAGTVYLSGDGRLWLWDIFNRDQEGIRPKTIKFNGKDINNRNGANYIEPAEVYMPFKQGFELVIDDRVWPLDHSGFRDIEFDGRYPMARIRYNDVDCPVEVILEAFSPFIPGNVDDSSLPATVMSFRIRNKSNLELKCIIRGHVENPVCIDSASDYSGHRLNHVIHRKGLSAVFCEALPAATKRKSGRKDSQSDHLVMSDTLPESKVLSELEDFGSFSLVLTGDDGNAVADQKNPRLRKVKTKSLSDSVIGRVEKELVLHPGGDNNADFALCWYFPNFYGRDFGGVKVGHSYAARFDSAMDVAEYLAKNHDYLHGTTRRWVETWYDSSLPYWLLDRTMANTTTLATTTCYRHKNGRFWAWEGVGCCTGTCTHVWHYAQAVGRLFPEIERDQRERVDFGMALKENGEIGYRALLESSMGPAFDGQCGRILGAYREHMMSVDDSFLTRNWSAIKKAVQYMIDHDIDLDGILDGAQPNTLDASWYGKISFISSLYIAALRAAEKMALEVDDKRFADKCSDIADRGAKNILELFNGEFFFQIEDPEHKDVIGVGTGCYIDQIFGQAWAHWVGLGNVFDRDKQLSALRSLWRYNFVPDVGPFRRHFTAGRWYAMAGDGGLLMCTWPKGGKRDKWEDQWQFMYFNECMSGFEWQAAANMIYEGIDNPDILQNGLAVSRAIHDRYNARLRNPYNEIECSDHYARAMASYGVFQAVCGFNYHGPKGVIEFDPRLTPDKFKTAFVTAEGWGSYSQELSGGKMNYSLELKHGRLQLQQWIVRLPSGVKKTNMPYLSINDKKIELSAAEMLDGKLIVSFSSTYMDEGDRLQIQV